MPQNNSELKNKRVPLNRETIIAKALEIADEEGLENLSIRKLASALDRSAMALYRHFGLYGGDTTGRGGTRIHRSGYSSRARRALG